MRHNTRPRQALPGNQSKTCSRSHGGVGGRHRHQGSRKHRRTRDGIQRELADKQLNQRLLAQDADRWEAYVQLLESGKSDHRCLIDPLGFLFVV